ncbi:MAG: YHYH protein [Pseudomonadota bacterium]
MKMLLSAATIVLCFNLSSALSDSPIDITNQIFSRHAANCADYVDAYKSDVKDINNNKLFEGALNIKVENGNCIIKSNGIPNHDFDDGPKAFPNNTTTQNDIYIITQSPKFANTPTPISLGMDNGIFLNGVKLDMLAAACYGVGPGPIGQEKIGCHDLNQPFRYDPMYAHSNFIIDSHHAHTQPTGAYHYHGNPMAMFDNDSAIESPVIGFAADGFPIYGSYFNDNGVIRKAKSSYVIKNDGGPRKEVIYSGVTYSPGGHYDGKFVDDYEYDPDSGGDLDECNGMNVNGQYGYYVTDTFPWIINCFRGTPDDSFKKRPPNGQAHHQRPGHKAQQKPHQRPPPKRY